MSLWQKYGKVAVLMGGNSPEREISLISGKFMLQALLDNGINAHKFDPAEQPLHELKALKFDRALLAVHGKNVEDGRLQGALEYLNVPYSGSGVLASSLAMDKYRTKLLWSKFNIPMAKSQYIKRQNFDFNSFILELSLPVVVKPSCGGSTLGLTKVYDIKNLSDAISLAFIQDDSVLIEELIIGSEFSITIHDGVCYPLVKIEAENGEYDYQNKYFTNTTKYIYPYELNSLLMQEIETHAKIACKVLKVSGVVRIDFMLDDKNNIFFLELNTLPGMTDHSLVPMAFKAKNISYNQLCLILLETIGLNK